jgi:Condensation domain
MTADRDAQWEKRLLARRGHKSHGIVGRPGAQAPLSFGQEEMWRAEHQHRGGVTNAILLFQLVGELNESALRRAVSALHEQHSVLRTVFVPHGGTAEQVVQPATAVPVPTIRLDSADEAYEFAREAGEIPYRLAQEPPVRWRLVRLAASRHILVLCLHHLVTDAWSEGLIRRDLALLYRAFAADRPPAPGSPALRYTDYAWWQRDRLSRGELMTDLAYWRDSLAEAPDMIPLPFDHTPRADSGYSGETFAADLPAKVLGHLRELARAEHASLFMALATVFGKQLAGYAGNEDVLLGTVLAGRTRPELAEVAGYFGNTVALRLDLSGPSEPAAFRGLLQRTRDVTLRAYSHQEAPFELVRGTPSVSDVSNETGRPKLVQALCLLADEPTAGRGPQWPGVQVSYDQVFARSASADLALTVLPGPTPSCLWEYRSALFEPATIRQVHADFARLLHATVAC